MSIQKGNKVSVEYTGTLEDGTEFDSSKNHNKPLEFEAGSGQLIKGFDEAVIGMEKNEEKEVKIPPNEAYGDYRQDLIQTVPKEEFPKDENLKVGMIIAITIPEGPQFPALIKEINNEEIILDLNHPLAGKTLIFKIKILDYS